MAETEMTTRILKLYETLRGGKEVKKLSFCTEHGISERTFDRDIEKIRLFLSEEYTGKEIKYSPVSESYLIPGIIEKGELSILELTIIIKILKAGRALEQHEFVGLVHSLQSVTDRRKRKKVLEFIQKELEQYEEKSGRKAFLKLLVLSGILYLLEIAQSPQNKISTNRKASPRESF